MKQTQLEDNKPFYLHTDRLLCVECCGCGKKHYESFKVISDKVIEITLNSKKGITYVKDVPGDKMDGVN